MRPVGPIVLAVTLVLMSAMLVRAQAPPSWKQGQPADMASSTLAPIAQPPAPKAPRDIPVDKIKVPAGFKVSLWAHGISNARVMTWGDKGTLFVSSRVAGNLYAVTDRGGQREKQEQGGGGCAHGGRRAAERPAGDDDTASRRRPGVLTRHRDSAHPPVQPGWTAGPLTKGGVK